MPFVKHSTGKVQETFEMKEIKSDVETPVKDKEAKDA